MRPNQGTALAVAVLAAAAPAQNLLSWNGWTAWNEPLVVGLNVTPTSITFAPFKAGPLTPETCGIEQTVTVPTTGTYQLHMIGGGGNTGIFQASWEIQGQSGGFPSEWRQQTWTFQLAAGTTTLRLESSTTNFPNELWMLEQPVLRPATAPTVDIEYVSTGGMPYAKVTTEAELLLMAPQSQLPIYFPGIMGGLELAPLSSVVLLANTLTPPTVFLVSGPVLAGQSWPSVYLQALTLTPTPRFGSLLAVQPWSF